MLTAREILRTVSVIIFTLGIVCLPMGWPPPNPKSWTSSFSLMAHAGQFQIIAELLSLPACCSSWQVTSESRAGNRISPPSWASRRPLEASGSEAGYITVMGEVRQPMRIRADRGIRLTKVIAFCGGLTEKADAKNIVVLGRHGIALYNLRRIRNSWRDPVIELGETVYVRD